MERIISLDLVIYLVIYSVTLLIFQLALKGKSNYDRKVGVFLTALFPSIFAGLRYEVGTDYYNYLRMFNKISSGSENVTEALFLYLNRALSWLGLPPQTIFFVASFIMMLLVCNIIYKKKETFNATIALLVFLILFFQSSFNIVRMMLAAGIVLYNFYNLEEKKLFKFTLFMLLAAGIHTSSLIMFPFYYLFNYFIYEKNRFKRLSLYFLVFLVIINIEKILYEILGVFNYYYFDRYTYYLMDINESSGLTLDALLQTIFYSCLVFPGILLYRKCIEIDRHFHIYFTLTVIGTIIMATSIFLPNYVYRLAEYFLILNVFVIPVYYKALKSHILGRLSILILIFSYWIIWYFDIGRHGTFDYNWIFNRF